MKKRKYLIICFLLVSFLTFAQSMDVSGTVIDNNGTPLPGVSVIEKGQGNGASSDFYGAFKIKVLGKDAVLVFKSIGFKTKEVVVGDQTKIDIQLMESADELGEVVVIGYGVQKKSDVTTSVASIGGEALEDEPVTNVSEALTGKLAGVQIRQTSGAPGSNINIRVRGTSSITAGSNPLYVIDGVPISNQSSGASSIANARNNYGEQPVNPLASINISDIQSIEVLKDAASAAIYGSRGSNGVVLITTKKGSSGKAQVSLTSRVGFSSVLNKIDMLDAYGFAELHRDAKNTAYIERVPGASITDNNATRVTKAKAGNIKNPTRYQIPDELQPYLNGQKGLTNTDWQDEIFRTAVQQDYTISMRGGGKKSKYFSSINYLKQDGIVGPSSLERFTGRLNLEGDVSKNIKYGVNLNPSRMQYRMVSSNGPIWNEGVVSSALAQAPVFPVRKDGDYGIGLLDWASALSFSPFKPSRNLSSEFVANPVAIANQVQDKRYVNRLIANSFVDIKIIDGLNYRVSLGTEINNISRNFYRPQSLTTLPWIRNNFNGTMDAASLSATTVNWLNEHTLSYVKDFNDHHVSLLGGYMIQEESIENLTASGNGFSNDLAPTLSAASQTFSNATREKWSLLSYLFRAQYNYRGKYFLSAAVRRDGSSRFGKGNKWGSFPSISGGWKVSEESFFPDMGINELKIRGSYGVTGNFQIPNYGAIAQIGRQQYINQGGSLLNGLSQITAANSNLSWENTNSFDVGLDMSILDNMISFGFDYYEKNTTGLLLNVNVPRTSGYSQQLQNIGEVKNSGFETSLEFKKSFGDLYVRASGNISTVNNEVIALGADGSPIYGNSGRGQAFIAKIGEPIASYYGYVVEGIYQNQKEIDGHLTKSNKFGSKPGDFKFKDLNGDGEITPDGDRKIIGNYYPDFYYGGSLSLNYKGIDLSATLQGVQGNEVLNTLRNYTAIPTGALNGLASLKNRWVSESNPGNGKVPRANFLTTGGNNQISTYYVEDGSYLKIQNITLGYKLDKNITDSIGIQGLRIYLSVQNPFLFTNYTGYNPEVSANPTNQLGQGEDFGTYPLARTYAVGLNFNF